MRFVKGQPRPPNAGRKSGTTNKFKKAVDTIAQAGLNPIAEILKLIPELDSQGKVDAWFDILSYCQAKPKDTGEEALLEIQDNSPATYKGLTEQQVLNIVRAGKEVS